ncbi:MAG: hypothetical protein KDC05_01250 [Bacteroidales bacterium]|nr:hypothetical protein [Bacteroidales bacterium]
MNTQDIERLIGKYEQGQTTAKEEELLKYWFSNEEVPEQLAIYKEIFAFYDAASEEELPDPEFDRKLLDTLGISEENVQNKSGMLRRLYPAFGIAASIVLLIGVYFIFQTQQPNTGTYDDPEIAYAEAKRVLLQVSGNLNTGMDELSNVKSMSKAVDELDNLEMLDNGIKEMKKISILDKSKQMITQ